VGLGAGSATVVPTTIGGDGAGMLVCWVSFSVTDMKSVSVDVTESVADAGPSL
jgi:hypothetical protein